MDLPSEIVIDIFKRLPLSSVISLARVNKRFWQIYVNNRASIVLETETLTAEFSPVGGLWRAATVSPDDLLAPRDAWLDKDILFKGKLVHKGSHSRVVAETATRHTLQQHPADIIRPVSSCGSGSNPRCIENADVDRILAICKVVKGWERIFPHYRFSHHPERLRNLSARESERLRTALYTWIRYDYYFHGDLPRPNPLEPARGDVRCDMIRTLSSGEEAELADLWSTVKDAVRALCPSLDAVRRDVEFNLPEEQASRIAWGSNRQENDLVVSTMLKLGPERLLHYINHKHEYSSKGRLIREIRQECPTIESDIETLSTALDVVHWERYRFCFRGNIPSPPALLSDANRRDPFGGILDWGLFEPLRDVLERGFGLGGKFDEDDDDGEDPRDVPAGALEP